MSRKVHVLVAIGGLLISGLTIGSLIARSANASNSAAMQMNPVPLAQKAAVPVVEASALSVYSQHTDAAYRSRYGALVEQAAANYAAFVRSSALDQSYGLSTGALSVYSQDKDAAYRARYGTSLDPATVNYAAFARSFALYQRYGLLAAASSY